MLVAILLLVLYIIAAYNYSYMNAPAKIIDDNFYQHTWRITSRIPHMQVTITDHLSIADCGLSCDTFNIIYIKQGGALTSEETLKAKTYFEDKGLAYTLWIEETQLTTSTRQLFEELGIRQTNKEPGMLLDLNTYQPVNHPLFSHIKKVSTLEEVGHFAEIVAQNWQPPDALVTKYYLQAAEQLLAPDSPTGLFNFYENNKPLAAVEVFASDADTIGIFSLSTLQAHRGRGIGTALMSFVLNYAKQRGYRQAVLQASLDGIGIYQRLGFSTRTFFYEWH